MDSYNVGDVIWVVGTERPGLRVMQVVEEVIKKTLTGEVTTYMVSLPTKGNASKKTINLEKVPGDIYTSSEEAKKAMLDNAESAIEKMFEHSQRLADSFFPQKELETDKTVKNEPTAAEDPNVETITLENGQVARVRIPEGF